MTLEVFDHGRALSGKPVTAGEADCVLTQIDRARVNLTLLPQSTETHEALAALDQSTACVASLKAKAEE